MKTAFEEALAAETMRNGYHIDEDQHLFMSGARWAKKWLEDNAPDPRQPSLPLVDRGRCYAYQASDQMVCGRCGLAWDMNDPDPPACPNQ